MARCDKTLEQNFANIKKKGKKASKTPKSTGTKKKNEVNSEDEDEESKYGATDRRKQI